MRATRRRNSSRSVKRSPSWLKSWTLISNPRSRISVRNSSCTSYRPSGITWKDDLIWKESSRSISLEQKSRPTSVSTSCVMVAHPDLPSGQNQMNGTRSEEHTSELQSRFGISYAVFCLKKKKKKTKRKKKTQKTQPHHL